MPAPQQTDLLTRLKTEGVDPIGTEALMLARAQAFLPLFGVDIATGHNPLFYGKQGDTISYTKGCFIGQETVARTRDRGHPPRRLVQLESVGQPQFTPGLDLVEDNRSVGTISSAVNQQEHLLAFALIKHQLAKTDHHLTDANGGSWRIVKVSDYQSD